MLLDNLASAIIHAAAGLALLSLKNNNQAAETAADSRKLIAAAGDDESERARRERLLHHLPTTENTEPLALAKYSYDRIRNLFLATCGAGPQIAGRG